MSNTMNYQEVFNTVKNHLLTQGVPAVRFGENVGCPTGCLYRGKGGLKCAVGVLIEDEFYSEDFEEQAPSQDLNPSKAKKMLWEALEKSLNIKLDTKSKEFLAELQEIHDDRQDLYEEEYREVNIEYWEGCLKDFATKYDLTY